jgi:uncharacterized protein DUF1707
VPASNSQVLLTAASGREPANGGVRVSDAERAEIADELSRHYTDGRLDEDEFGQRLDQAMQAKTYRDLTGLLQDLPASSGPPRPGAHVTELKPARQQRRRAGIGPLLVLILVVVAVAGPVRFLAGAVAPVLWTLVICALVLLAVRRRRRR